MSLVTCPTCHKQFDSEQSSSMPFCSGRCRAIDLNRWLSEEIAMPFRERDLNDRSDLPDDPAEAD